MISEFNAHEQTISIHRTDNINKPKPSICDEKKNHENFKRKRQFRKGPTVNQLLIETREKRTRGRTETRGQLNRGKACT